MLPTLAALGAFHGLNPAMGWLFAVALGLQEGRRGAVLRAIPPIALGHAAAIAIVLLAVAVAQRMVPPPVLRFAGGGALLLFGLYKLVRRGGHPRWVGMRVGFRDLAAWSFLMSSAHGAGLMLVPVVLGVPVPAHTDAGHVDVLRSAAVEGALVALAVHTAALLVVMTGIAVAVFELLGLELLRRAWVNLDAVWAVALMGAGVITLAM